MKKPNIMVILMDDMGFSDPGCYGGEIETPNMDRLAKNGLRYSQFYSTPRCWPTRSSILTGYYPPQVCMDPIRRDYRASWQRMIPDHLAPLGYKNYHSGKWHVFNTRDPEKEGGFDISWGYDIEQFNHFFHTEDGKTQFSSEAITDHALMCLKEHEQHAPEHPFFHYVCYTTPHFPVQAEQADIDKYRDRYLDGWDAMRQRRYERMKAIGLIDCALSDREPKVPAPHYLAHKEEWDADFGPGEIEHAVAWDKLTDEQKRFQATKMAIHAAMVDRTDREIGRILDKLESMQVLDDTLIVFLSDNGCSAEIMIRGQGHDPSALPGSAFTHLCLGPGWSTCCNTPFRRHKIWAHEGGVSSPLIVHWPKGIQTQGGIRHDIGHVVDFLPTFIDVAGGDSTNMTLPEGAPPLPGKSLVPSFTQDGTVQRDHIYHHHQGNRALRVGNWKIVNEGLTDTGKPEDRWALYDLSTDRCEMHDLAAENPALLEKLIAKWQSCEDTYRNPGTAHNALV
ncbi:MAG: arylsulfatase [Kiritimatiellia bacterium]